MPLEGLGRVPSLLSHDVRIGLPRPRVRLSGVVADGVIPTLQVNRPFLGLHLERANLDTFGGDSCHPELKRLDVRPQGSQSIPGLLDKLPVGLIELAHGDTHAIGDFLQRLPSHGGFLHQPLDELGLVGIVPEVERKAENPFPGHGSEHAALKLVSQGKPLSLRHGLHGFVQESQSPLVQIPLHELRLAHGVEDVLSPGSIDVAVVETIYDLLELQEVHVHPLCRGDGLVNPPLGVGVQGLRFGLQVPQDSRDHLPRRLLEGDMLPGHRETVLPAGHGFQVVQGIRHRPGFGKRHLPVILRSVQEERRIEGQHLPFACHLDSQVIAELPVVQFLL